MIPVGREIDDVGENLFTRPQPIPKQLEHTARHMGVTDDIMRRAQNLLLRVAAEGKKGLIGVGDPPLQIRLGDDELVVRKEHFPATEIRISLHYPPPKRGLSLQFNSERH